MSHQMSKSLVLKAGKLEIFIYNDIDSLWGFSASNLVEFLQGAPPKAPITVHINSAGGEVFEGLAIYNLLRNWSGEVTTVIEGIAASIASVIFLAGNQRQMADNSMLMIHSPMLSLREGNKEDFQASLELIQKAEDNISQIYRERTGASSASVTAWLKQDTYFTAKEALKLGFATEVLTSPDVIARANTNLLAAKLSIGVGTMDFAQWLIDYCSPLGTDPSKLTDQQRSLLQAKFEEQQKLNAKGAVTPPPLPQRAGGTPPPAGDLEDLDSKRLIARRQAEAAEGERVDSLQDLARQHSTSNLNEDYLKSKGFAFKTVKGLVNHAIREGWTVDRCELELRRASRQDVGPATIHVAQESPIRNHKAVACALLRSAGINPEKSYDQKDLEASDHRQLKNIGLHQMFDQAILQATGSRYDGRYGTDGFISSVREALWTLRAANTTWGGLTIFDDVANKMLLAAYASQATTWQEWVTPVSVSDFKTHNFYRMTMQGGYMKVGAGGELKHGGFDDDKYSVSANTFGKIVGLARRDLINDDLGALNRVMAALGIEGARFLEELFYAHFLNQQTTLFPTDGSLGNYVSGATVSDLTVDGLTLVEKTFLNQTDGDGGPLMVTPDRILVGTQDSVYARELFTKTELYGLQSANLKGRPDGNIHVGKFRPIVTPYLNNTALKQRTDSLGTLGAVFPNQTTNQWFMMCNPNSPLGGIVLGAFLNGVRTPTLEQADAAFDTLGLQWRAYHDAGVGNGDPKLAVMSKGAA